MKIISIILTSSFNPAFGYTFNVRLSNGAVLEESSESLFNQFGDEAIFGDTKLNSLLGKEFSEKFL